MLSARLRSVYNPTLSFLPNLGLAAVLLVGGSEAIAGTISVGDFVAFYGYVVMLTSPLRMLGVALGMAQRAVASGARIFEILDRQATLTAPRSPRPMPEGSGHIEMRGVSFSHNGSGPILSEINLDVQAGKTVALVGPTGAGKTTLAALIPRLYDATTGSVSVDGTDVRLVDPSALRREIALVSDDPFLFSQSLRDNIAYARPDATQPEIELAAQQAGLRDFVAELSEGYDTLIGERGLTLSGGQRQRVAIARALLKDPRILILDDATSSIDATTETQIRLALAEIMRDRTTIVIAHRLSTIALADEIVVLANGAIASRGTHSELLTNSSLYRDIVAKGLPETVFFTATEGTGAAGL
jgi:ATP-binding cassette subfamily B protein